MKNDPIALFNFWTENKKVFKSYMVMAVVVLLSAFAFLVVAEKTIYAVALIGGLATVWVITQPKFVLYQFIFIMFTNALLVDRFSVMLIDISALLVIVTAWFDLLLKGEYKFALPKLSFNFIAISIAFFIVALFGYNPSLSVMPILHVLYLFLTFVSLYSLSKYASVEKLLHLYFMLAVMHAFIALLPVIGGAKMERLFGFARSTLDDIMMIAFPIGLVYFMRASSRKMFYYLIALLLIIGALIGTQSRLSIMFALFFGAIAVYFSLKRGQQRNNKAVRRIQIISVASVSFVAMLFVLSPEFINVVMTRFGSLLSSAPSETFLVRIVLWTNALTTFADNPILGIGLGHYKILNTIYSSIHLHYMFPYIQNYSAHNMFFHYLAETGVVGTTAVFALILNQFRYS